MVMLKPPGKAYEIGKKVLKGQGIKVPDRTAKDKKAPKSPYLQH